MRRFLTQHKPDRAVARAPAAYEALEFNRVIAAGPLWHQNEVDIRMAKCKISVLKTMFNVDLAEEYRRPDVHFGPCPHFAVGDVFVVEHIGVRPEGFFCDWAWDDIQKVLLAMQLGGDFSPWMKDERTFIACCTDGVKPVVFKLERIDERRAQT